MTSSIRLDNETSSEKWAVGRVAQTNNASLNSASDTQLANLLQDLLNSSIQIAIGILISSVRIQVLLDLSHSRVSFGTEAQLDLDESLKGRIQVGNAEFDELGQFREELFVELVIGGACHFCFLFCAGQFGNVLVGLFGEAFHLGADAVVVEEFVVAFLDAWGRAAVSLLR